MLTKEQVQKRVLQNDKPLKMDKPSHLTGDHFSCISKLDDCTFDSGWGGSDNTNIKSKYDDWKLEIDGCFMFRFAVLTLIMFGLVLLWML